MDGTVKPARFEIALRMIITLIVLVWLCLQWGMYYVDLWVPLYRFTLTFIAPDFVVLDLKALTQHGDGLVAARLATQYAQFIEGKLLAPGIEINVTTLAGHAYKHFIIIVGAVLILPHLSFSQRMIRLALSVPALLLIEILDIPFVLAGAAQDLLQANSTGNATSAHLSLIPWMRMLDGGGRLALPIIAAVSVASLHNAFLRRSRQ